MPGVVTEHADTPRPYVVNTQEGRLVRRNTLNLKDIPAGPGVNTACTDVKQGVQTGGAKSQLQMLAQVMIQNRKRELHGNMTLSRKQLVCHLVPHIVL